MKTHQLILLTTALFVTLFYGETMGINFGILGIVYALLTLYQTPEENRTRTFLFLFVLAVFSSIAFAYYGDFASFLAVFSTLFLLAFKSKNRNLKSLLVIPLFVVNFVTFIYRVFQFAEWLPQRNVSASWQKFLSVVLIPAVFVFIFFGIYSFGSDHFSRIFSRYEFDLNFWEFIGLTCLGFFIAFNFWNFKIYPSIFKVNHTLKNDFVNEDKVQLPTYTFLNIEAERKSGAVSFFVLNVLLFVFLLTFNYEQFVEVSRTPNQLSMETHERVNAVILSIVMAIIVIMFYFKGNFNFDEKAKSLKILARIWVALNIILVFSAAAKNSEYIYTLGLTYKRLGVYAFLILAGIGLVLTFFKIQKQKTNAYLFNHMIWYFYGTVLACSFVNWGGLATFYNIKNDKGNFEFLSTFNFNDKYMREKFPLQIQTNASPAKIECGTFLSRTLYEETLKSYKK